MEGNGNRGLEKNSQFDWNVEVSKNFSNFAMETQVKRKKEIVVSIIKFKINLNKIWKFLYYKYRRKKLKWQMEM